MYMPELKSFGDILPLNFEMLIRVETNLKLNLIDKDGLSLIPSNEIMQDEVHFLRFESVVNEYTISFKTIWQLLKEMKNRPPLQFSNWTITDLDDFLKGNPHIVE